MPPCPRPRTQGGVFQVFTVPVPGLLSRTQEAGREERDHSTPLFSIEPQAELHSRPAPYPRRGHRAYWLAPNGRISRLRPTIVCDLPGARAQPISSHSQREYSRGRSGSCAPWATWNPASHPPFGFDCGQATGPPAQVPRVARARTHGDQTEWARHARSLLHLQPSRA